MGDETINNPEVENLDLACRNQEKLDTWGIFLYFRSKYKIIHNNIYNNGGGLCRDIPEESGIVDLK